MNTLLNDTDILTTKALLSTALYVIWGIENRDFFVLSATKTTSLLKVYSLTLNKKCWLILQVGWVS